MVFVFIWKSVLGVELCVVRTDGGLKSLFFLKKSADRKFVDGDIRKGQCHVRL